MIPFSALGNQAKKIILEVHPCGTELPAYSLHNSVHRLFKILILKSFNVFNTYKKTPTLLKQIIFEKHIHTTASRRAPWIAPRPCALPLRHHV